MLNFRTQPSIAARATPGPTRCTQLHRGRRCCTLRCVEIFLAVPREEQSPDIASVECVLLLGRYLRAGILWKWRGGALDRGSVLRHSVVRYPGTARACRGGAAAAAPWRAYQYLPSGRCHVPICSSSGRCATHASTIVIAFVVHLACCHVRRDECCYVTAFVVRLACVLKCSCSGAVFDWHAEHSPRQGMLMWCACLSSTARISMRRRTTAGLSFRHALPATATSS